MRPTTKVHDVSDHWRADRQAKSIMLLELRMLEALSFELLIATPPNWRGDLYSLGPDQLTPRINMSA